MNLPAFTAVDRKLAVKIEIERCRGLKSYQLTPLTSHGWYCSRQAIYLHCSIVLTQQWLHVSDEWFDTKLIVVLAESIGSVRVSSSLCPPLGVQNARRFPSTNQLSHSQPTCDWASHRLDKLAPALHVTNHLPISALPAWASCYELNYAHRTLLFKMSLENLKNPYVGPPTLPSHEFGTDDSLVKTGPAGHMGCGLFAVKDMPAGTRIVSETPLITVPGNQKQRTLAENVIALCQAVLKVDVTTHYALLKLSKPFEYDQQTSDAVENFFKQMMMPQHILPWSVESFSKISCLYQKRAVDLPDHGASGFFHRLSVINHSCSPNAQAYFDPVHHRHQVQLVRDVKAGDQIFVSYISGIDFPRARRHAEILAKGHDFVCDCALCTSQEAEAMMQKVPVLYRGICDVWERACGRGRPQQRNSTWIPRNETTEAVAHAEELLGILRHPSVDVVGQPLSLALEFCIWFHRDLGNIKAAAAYARERLVLHIRLYGFEAENFLSDDDASRKLRMLESEIYRMEVGNPWGLDWDPMDLGEV